MNCTLCSETMVVSQTMRPNHATFECGHSFHLSCVLQYSKEKITNTCPICEPRAGFFADFGDDRLKAMSILIDKRRKANKMEKPKGFRILVITEIILAILTTQGQCLMPV